MKKKIREYALLATGAFLLAVGFQLFLVPFQLSSGGIGTLGVVLLYYFKIPLSATNLAVNLILFLLGIRWLKRDAVVKTVFGVLCLSVFLEFTDRLPAFSEDIFLAMVIGGVLDGIGLGLVLKSEGSTGGIDFCGLMVKERFPRISVAYFVFAVNCVLFFLSGLVFRSLSVAFYSGIAMYLSSRITEVFLSIGEKSKSIRIISEQSERIEEILLRDFGRGVTEIDIRGAFSREKRKMLLCVAAPKEIFRIVRLVRSIDERAFLVISDVYEVWGEGFRTS